MWRRVGLVRTDISEEPIANIFMVEKSASVDSKWDPSCWMQNSQLYDSILEIDCYIWITISLLIW
jgi:hypothetical protein